MQIHRPATGAGQDLDEQAYNYTTEASAELGHRFLVAAHDIFALLATQPKMGWQPQLRHQKLKQLRVFRVRGFERMLVLYLPMTDGVEILRVIHGSRNLQAMSHREIAGLLSATR